MYIITFYSYKGGVGRSQALINVAIELSKRGKKVLLVDFDLEAPGLYSFDLFNGRPCQKGVVDFVNDYLENLCSPSIENYLIQSKPFFGDHHLWLMPAGKQAESYGGTFSSIDWNDLYLNKSGYLLIEDLKQQWRETLDPDYVLIDSRTGHTDIGGICTRQLPDAIVAMMFPNDQNIIGMHQIILDIRKSTVKADLPKFHFVFSNVPELDDEDGVLDKLTTYAGQKLGFERETGRIHHYASLDLLQQSIHTLNRPTSRLAKEYIQLTNSIVMYNIEDKEGALAWLRKTTIRNPSEWADFSQHLVEIISNHKEDPAVLAEAGNIRLKMDEIESACQLYQTAIGCGNKEPKDWYNYAFALWNNKQFDQSSAILAEILRMPNCDPLMTTRVIKRLTKIGQDNTIAIEALMHTPEYEAIQNLNDGEKIELAHTLLSSGLEATSKQLISNIIQDGWRRLDMDDRSNLALFLIGTGNVDEALAVLKTLEEPHDTIQTAFNFSMARWLKDGTPSKDLFSNVISLEGQGQFGELISLGPNYNQCLAISFAILGDTEEAKNRLARSIRAAQKGLEEIFSAWRYHRVNAKEFIEDNGEIKKFIEGEDILPKFFSTQLSH